MWMYSHEEYSSVRFHFWLLSLHAKVSKGDEESHLSLALFPQGEKGIQNFSTVEQRQINFLYRPSPFTVIAAAKERPG